MNTAFRVARPASYYSDTNGVFATPYEMPKVTCDQCGRTWLDTGDWYPNFGLDKDADLDMFSLEENVSVEAFQELKRHVVGRGVGRAALLPGCGLGPVTATVPANPTDFVWCCFSLLAKPRVVDILKRAGVRISFGPAVVQIGKRQSVEDFVALQVEPVRLYSDQTLAETTTSFCTKCGNVLLKNVRAEPKGPLQYVRNRIPNRQGLVRVYESVVVTLASAAFIEAVRRHRLTGIEFEEAGVYV
ncbi:MAG: double-CXXCG motif protein [Verrucomicrobiota bacterium]|jgi:hypothetical protein